MPKIKKVIKPCENYYQLIIYGYYQNILKINANDYDYNNHHYHSMPLCNLYSPNFSNPLS